MMSSGEIVCSLFSVVLLLCITGLACFKIFLLQTYPHCKNRAKLTGKTVIITGKVIFHEKSQQVIKDTVPQEGMAQLVLWGLSAAVTTVAIGGYIYMKKNSPVYCKSTTTLNGRTVIITGANTGIGKETAVDLAKRGARVICACRDENRGKQAMQDIREMCGHTNVIYEMLDLADFQSIRDFADRIKEQEKNVHILINNAGTLRKNEVTKQGFDHVFGVNHLGHFLLTYLLLDLLKTSAPSRIINVSSDIHRLGKFKNGLKKVDGSYPEFSGYAASKAANVLHVKELTRLLEGKGVTANAVHPGFVASDIWRRWMEVPVLKYLWGGVKKHVMWDCTAGAQTSIYCAVEENLETVSGKYFFNCAIEQESSVAADGKLVQQLWNASMDACGLLEN